MIPVLAILGLCLPQADAFPSEDDRRELKELLRIQRTYGDGVWPGFGAAVIPIVLYDERFEYLFGHPAPPKEWTRLEAFIEREGDLFVRPAERTQGFAVKVGGVWCGSFATFEHMASRLKRGRDFHIAATLHETFHAFQAQSAPERFAAAMKVYALEERYPESTPGLAEDWKREGALLAGAQVAKTPEEARDLAATILEFRADRRRRARIGEDLIVFETQLEWLEGLGKYAEVKIVELAIEDSKVQPLYDLSPAKRRWAADLVQLRGGLGLAKGDIRYYQSGMAQARLLDRLKPQWKKAELGGVLLEHELGSALQGGH